VHTAYYGDVTFTNAGAFDFEVASFNSGGAGDVEFSVSTQSGGNDRSAITSGSWELIGQTTGNVSLQGTIAVTSYQPTGDPVLVTRPMLVLLNGPDDTPPGSVFGGGPFTGFEGAGFFAGAALNKFPLPGTDTFRTLRMSSVNVAGKTNVKMTVALAATFLDFETSDFLDIIAYPTGVANPEVLIAHYSAPDGNTKYFVDLTHNNSHRLGLSFQDVTYDIPPGATDLVIEFRSLTTWWNEIVAFDNVRITEGTTVAAPSLTANPAVAANTLTIAWPASALGYILQSSPTLGSGAAWTLVTGSPNPISAAGSIDVNTASGNGTFYRLKK
jgi:hypothetical protein